MWGVIKIIIVDLNQVAIATITAQAGNHADAVQPDLIRHMILNSIRKYKTKFSDYGEVVIASDDKKYWRREMFPYYKANRKADREKSDFDWPMIFNTIATVRDELQENFPYRVLRVSGAEADDIIATLCKNFHDREKILIVSNDKDFIQLLRYNNVAIYRTLTDELVLSREIW